MSLISYSSQNLINGVSQQPPSMRRPTQAEEQVNALSSVVSGLLKRPPAEHIIKAFDGSVGNAKIQYINRDSSERYVLMLTGSSIQVRSLDGTIHNVSAPDGYGYLNCTTPSDELVCVTVADHTFVLNKTKSVAAATATYPTRSPETLIHVKQGNYGKTYKVKLNSLTVATYTTPDGSAPGHSLNIDTSYIATQLYNQVNSDPAFNVSRYGSTVHISRVDAADFDVDVEDGFNGNAMVAVKGKVQRFSDLPSKGPVGYVVEVAGDDANNFDNYYVKAIDSGSGILWEESTAPGIVTGLDASTLPFILVREANGTFTFKQATWENRLAGDTESAPDPSFVGRNITDIFFHRNRLGFLSDEAVIFSAAGDYFNFFPTTVTTLLDDAPIDAQANHTKVSLLRHAVPFNESLMLFSDQTQFSVGGGDILTNKTITIDPSTEFDSSPLAKPVGAGSSLYFVVDNGQYSAIREYFVSPETDANDAADATAHVPHYLPGGIHKLSVSPNLDILVALSTNDPSTLYVYKYYWSGNEKLQSAWSKWTIENGTILNAELMGSDLFLLVQRSDGAYLEKMNIESGHVDTGARYVTHLDRRVDESLCDLTYFAGTDKTEIMLPYPETGNIEVVYKDNGVAGEAGQSLNPVKLDDWRVEVQGNVTGKPLWLGLKYATTYRFSKQLIRLNGQEATFGGVAQIRNFLMAYANTAYFEVRVTPKARSTYKTIFSGNTLGVAVTGDVNISDGSIRVPVMANNQEVTVEVYTDSHLPMALTGAEPEVFYKRRNQRI